MFQISIADKIETNIVCSVSSEQVSGWALGQSVWTLRTGNKETHFQTVFLDIPPEATELWSKEECKHLPP
jgi:hypothetical protein